MASQRERSIRWRSPIPLFSGMNCPYFLLPASVSFKTNRFTQRKLSAAAITVFTNNGCCFFFFSLSKTKEKMIVEAFSPTSFCKCWEG